MTCIQIGFVLSLLKIPIYMKSLTVSLLLENADAIAHQAYVCLFAQTVQNSFLDLFQLEMLSIYGLSCFLIQ